MFFLLLLLSLPQSGILPIPQWDPPATAIHIDPDNHSDPRKDGTIEHPFSSFTEVKWKNDGVYAIKRGSTIHIEETLILEAHRVTLASYGKGQKPVIHSSSESHAVSTHWQGGTDMTIRDLEIYAPKAQSCVIFRDNSRNAKLINCKLHGSEWGLRVLNNISGITVHNTEIFDIRDDGIFMKNTEHIVISNCFIHKTNKNWKSAATSEELAGGDGIQFEACNHWHVHNNRIDRRDTGNKFCFISNNPLQDNGIFEYNYLSGPLLNGSSIYLHDGTNLIVRYNYIEGPSNSPLYSHGNALKIYSNIFSNISGPLFVSGSAEIYNNLFYQCRMGIEGGMITARNNIFDIGFRTVFKVSNLTESHNLFVHGIPSRGSFSGKPNYRDPENSDFYPELNSACIDKGIAVGIETDMNKTKIPQGSAPDIGPYEFIIKEKL